MRADALQDSADALQDSAQSSKAARAKLHVLPHCHDKLLTLLHNHTHCNDCFYGADVQAACEELKLDGLVVIGGNRTHTDAAYLSEHFQALGVKTCVVGAPCSISGGMRNQFVEAAVGYDTAVKVSCACLCAVGSACVHVFS
jgi:Phosphofructokinase